MARKLQTAHARAESRREGGRGAGADRPGVGTGAAGLLPPSAAGARFPAGQRRPAEAETPPGVALAPCCTATVPPSGSLGRLRLARGRARVRAFAVLCSGPCPCRCPLCLHPPTRLVAPGHRSCPYSSPVPRGPARVPRRGNLPSALGPSCGRRRARRSPARAAGPSARPQGALGL